MACPSWEQSGPCYTYRDVQGTRTYCKKRGRTGCSDKWDKLVKKSAEQSIYEEIDAPDEQIPQLQRKADGWDELTSKVPGFTRPMIILSDLLYHTDELVIEDLNDALSKRGLEGVDYVSGVLYHLTSKYRPEAERKALIEALGEVFGAAAGTLHDRLFSQWKTVSRWKNKRLLFAHPLRDMGEKDLLALRKEIKEGTDYQDVHDVADLMLNMLLQKPVEKKADGG